LSSADTKENIKREIQVEIPADIVTRQTDTLVQKYQKLARLPGFRRGHVPASIIRQRFAEDLKSEVVEALVPKYFVEEAEKQGLKPVSQPRISDLHIHEGEPLRFKAAFEVLPELDVEGYKELRAERKDSSVSDEEVEQAFSDLREQQASFNPVEGRPLQDGDYAQASVNGVPKEEGGKPIHMDDVLIQIGGANTVREFSENLRGVNAGESKSFEVTYPEDFSDERLRGKALTYTVNVKAIKQKNLPESNDEFAKSVGDFANLEDLRKKIREQMESEKKRTSEREAKDKLLDELVNRHELEVPEALIENQIDIRLDRGLRALAAQGMRTEDMKKLDVGRLRAGQRELALREVKSSLLLEKIAELEKIEVSDEELNREIDAIATQAKQSPEAIRARLTRDGADARIRSRLRNEKTLDFLYQQSA